MMLISKTDPKIEVHTIGSADDMDKVVIYVELRLLSKGGLFVSEYLVQDEDNEFYLVDKIRTITYTEYCEYYKK